MLKPSSFGWAEGCLEITVTSSDGCEIVEKATGSEAVSDISQLDKAFDTLVKHQTNDAKQQQGQDGKEGSSCLKLKGEAPGGKAIKTKVPDIDDDEDSLLARVKSRRVVQGIDGAKPPSGCAGMPASSPMAAMAATVIDSSSDAASANTIAAPRRGVSRVATKGAGAGTGGQTKATVANKSSVPPSKRLREVTGAAPWAQEAQHYRSWLAAPVSFPNCSTQQAKRIFQNLDKRAQPNRAAAFLGGPIPGWDGDPVTVLNDIRNLLPKFAKVSSMMEAPPPRCNSNRTCGHCVHASDCAVMCTRQRRPNAWGFV